MKESDSDRFETKRQALNSLADNIGPSELLKKQAAFEYAAPWGEVAQEAVIDRTKPFKDYRAVPYSGTDPNDLMIGANELLKILVEQEGEEPQTANFAGVGLTAEVEYNENVELIQNILNDT
ncbi:hypothetical protein ACFQJ7_05950 [Halovenus rubra]|uniref:Uncharacterized protein n=2 Tax=Halovenus rubra TaxID=869890 RepID=A0ABD5X383_9EURY|nr:hypothetical protein [Halovenus rubra]